MPYRSVLHCTAILVPMLWFWLYQMSNLLRSRTSSRDRWMSLASNLAALKLAPLTLRRSCHSSSCHRPTVPCRPSRSRRKPHMTCWTRWGALASSSTGGVDLVSYARRKKLPGFSAVYRAVLKRVAVIGLPRLQDEAAIMRATVVGTVSTYNPYRDGNEGGAQTASGELYDPAAWTAAIKTDLRNQFRVFGMANFIRRPLH